ncbi:MAG: hypothetical protein U0900_12540 [Myxococcota bacterium]
MGQRTAVHERTVEARVAVVEEDAAARDVDPVGELTRDARQARVGEGPDALALVQGELAQTREIEGLADGEGLVECDAHALEALGPGIHRRPRRREIVRRHAGDRQHRAHRRRQRRAVAAEPDVRERLEGGRAGALAHRPGDPHAIPDGDPRGETALPFEHEEPLRRRRIAIHVAVLFLDEEPLERGGGRPEEAPRHDRFDLAREPDARRVGAAALHGVDRDRGRAAAVVVGEDDARVDRAAEAQARRGAREREREMLGSLGEDVVRDGQRRARLGRPVGDREQRAIESVVAGGHARSADAQGDGLAAHDRCIGRRPHDDRAAIELAGEGGGDGELHRGSCRAGLEGRGRGPRQRGAGGEVEVVREAIDAASSAAGSAPEERARGGRRRRGRIALEEGGRAVADEVDELCELGRATGRRAAVAGEAVDRANEGDLAARRRQVRRGIAGEEGGRQRGPGRARREADEQGLAGRERAGEQARRTAGEESRSRRARVLDRPVCERDRGSAAVEELDVVLAVDVAAPAVDLADHDLGPRFRGGREGEDGEEQGSMRRHGGVFPGMRERVMRCGSGRGHV